MGMIGRGRFVSCAEQYHLTRSAIDEIDTAREIIADRPSSIRRRIDMPQSAAGFGLSGDEDFLRSKIYDRETRGVFARAGYSPGIVHAGFAMSENRERDFVLRRELFVGDPFVHCLGIRWPEAAAIGHDDPGALRGLAAGFPTKHDFA